MSSATLTVIAAKIPGLSGGDYVMDVKSSTIKLDEAHVPYGNANLVVALPADSILSQITPYSTQRIQITVDHSWVTPVRPDQVRTFDFLLHERTIDHKAGTLTLVGQTDEAMLIDRVNISSTLARTYGLSVKTACDYALTLIGATLESGAVDATLTSKTLEPTITNLHPNPGAEVNANSVTNGGNFAVSRVTTKHRTGVAAFALTAAAAGGATAILDANPATIPVTAGLAYTVAVYSQAAVTGRSVTGAIRWFNASNVQVGSDVNGTAVTDNTTGWTRFVVTGIAPAGATKMWPLANFAALASAEIHYLDDIQVIQSNQAVEPFDGGNLGGRDAGLYAVAWTGTANASTSTLTNLPNTDATIWQPGQSLDRWLDPILSAGNRRLFCDEHRKWRLVDGSYTIDGTLTVSEGFNAKSGTDTMSRQKTEQGIPTWFDHVIVHYQWTDALGIKQEMWDSASSGTVKGYLVEVSTPWPGPGAAAGILSRATGRGRTQDITALTDYLGTPGMAIVTTLPGTPIQSGVLSSIAWRWDKSADDMTVTSRGLINTPANAWLFAIGAWSAATGSWTAATGTN